MASTALRRIHADIRELKAEKNPMIHAAPLPDNMFEWHFTIQGPPESDYAGGIYHGRLLLPAEWPMKPPKIIFMTVNGRFEVNTPVCLSISSFHPEEWQPSWGIRSILEAIITYFPTDSDGAVGSLSCSSEMRKKFAKESRKYVCPNCGAIINLVKPISEEEIKSHYTSPIEKQGDGQDGQEGQTVCNEQENHEEKKDGDESAPIQPALSPDMPCMPISQNPLPTNPVEETSMEGEVILESRSDATEEPSIDNVEDNSQNQAESDITKRVLISSRFTSAKSGVPDHLLKPMDVPEIPDFHPIPPFHTVRGTPLPEGDSFYPFIPPSFMGLPENGFTTIPDLGSLGRDRAQQDEGVRERTQPIPFVPIFVPVIVPVVEKSKEKDEKEVGKQKEKKWQICVTVFYVLMLIAYYAFFYLWKFSCVC